MSTKFLGRKTGEKQHQLHERFRQRGGLRSADKQQDVFATGVQVIQPLTQDGQPIATGSYYTFGEQEVRTMDGTYRLIDSGVLNDEIAIVRANEEALLDMVEMFIKSGSDTIARKYMGGFFDYLANGANKETQLTKFLESAGMTNAMAKAQAKAFDSVEARPSNLRYMPELGEDFGKGIQKLKTILSFCGLVFDNKKLKRDPEGIRGAVRAAEPTDGTAAKINDLLSA
jgi:hypothetical protein